jgi:hypothetical protein
VHQKSGHETQSIRANGNVELETRKLGVAKGVRGFR